MTCTKLLDISRVMQYALKTKVPNATISVFVSADQIPG